MSWKISRISGGRCCRASGGMIVLPLMVVVSHRWKVLLATLRGEDELTMDGGKVTPWAA